LLGYSNEGLASGDDVLRLLRCDGGEPAQPWLFSPVEVARDVGTSIKQTDAKVILGESLNGE